MQAYSQSSSAARIGTHAGRVPLPPPGPTIASMGLVHDIANLLNALHLYAGLLERPGVLRQEHSHYAQELLRLAERSNQLLEQLDTDSLPLDAVTANSHDIASGVLGLKPLLDRIAAPAILTLEIDATLPAASVSADTVERLILNLVSNAAEALSGARLADPMRERGSICVRLQSVDGRLLLEVEDNGPGMPPPLAAAFLRPRPQPMGVKRGLGHRIIHDLLRKSGAALKLRVRPARGTCFEVTWPSTRPATLLERRARLTGEPHTC